MGRSVTPILCSLLAFAITSCGWMSADQLTFFEGETVVSRSDAIAELQLGIVTHSSSCPLMETAAIYTLNGVLQKTLNRTHYYKNSVDFCFLILVSTPCPSTTNNTISAGFYEAIVRSCNPGPAT
ncbi:MAG: hypothetical protein KDK33_02720 [Leptospiraceae bacterium]|nr:hypothetical protein [Leptospiraceae bacterium]